MKNSMLKIKSYRSLTLASLTVFQLLLIACKNMPVSQSSNTHKAPENTHSIDKIKPIDIAKHSWAIDKIENQKALKALHNRKKIVVAIIDTGIDVEHPNLKNNLWKNPNEQINGLDDDHNGFVDDTHGWDFTTNSPQLTDHHGHGTHIAGIIKSIAPNVSIMAIKYYDSTATAANNLKNTVLAIQYAVKMNVDIINYSGGGTTPDDDEKAAILAAEKKGILFVAAAGNEKSDADKIGFYPANYDLDNIISVTAVDARSNILKSSNFGLHSIDIAAPGKDILSTLPNFNYGDMTGTSQATAFVSGAAALVLSNQIGPRNLPLLKSHLLTTGMRKTSLATKTRYGLQLNTYHAVAMQDTQTNAFGTQIENDSTEINNLFSSDRQ